MRNLPALLLSTLLALAAVLAPTAAAQGVGQSSDEDVRAKILAKPGSDITFYGHVFGFGRGTPMPMNTQFPVNEEDYSLGTASGCGNPPPAPDDSADCVNWASNEEYFYTTAGFVQVKSQEEWGSDYGKFHNERGQTKDIYLDTSKKASYTFYMSADFHGYPSNLCVAACWNWDPGIFQHWVIESWIMHANLGNWSTNPSSPPSMNDIHHGLGGGAVIVAHGRTEPFDMHSFDPTVPVVGSQTVYPFSAEYEWDPAFAAAGGVIPYDHNMIVQFEWYQLEGEQKYILGTPASTPNWNVNGGENYPNRVVLPVRNPMDVELVYPRFVHDKLVVLAILNTPWGSYDIDPTRTQFIVKDKDGQVIDIPEHLITETLDSSVAHGGHYKPINATWVWDYQAQDLAPGEYTLTIGSTNFQHSYSTATDATFTITSEGKGGGTTAGRGGLQSFSQDEFERFQESTKVDVTTTTTTGSDGGDKGSPGFGLAAALAALAVGALALRRRAR